MILRLASVVLMAILAVSCGPAGSVDYSGIRSVSFANGMEDKLNRNRVGTTIFNNRSESVIVPGLSREVTSTAIGVLKGKVDRVVNLDVPTSPAKFSLLTGRSPTIDAVQFRNKAIAAAKAGGVDAVWIVFPGQYSAYGSRGPATIGYEHRQDSFLGITNDTVHFTAVAEFIDARSGTTLRTSATGPLGIKQIESEDWRKNWSETGAARKKVVIDGITETSNAALRLIMN